jgi:uncharacterized protein DUF6252
VRRTSLILASLALAAATACGGSDSGKATGPTGTGTLTGDGNVSATFNGTAWRSLKTGDRVNKNGQFYGISAVNPPYAIIISIASATGPGTFNLNLTAGGDGSSGIVSNTTGGWATSLAGGSGTITVTTLTANRIVGTFSFGAVPTSGNASGTMQVRNGKFDVTF